uniref:Uncharacterized protein n=1 Tax=Rangifer tarandus platyrhynchus TaxID=3082113 RepID=A0ACB0EW27_RANTA|nr:unnamed protein product [Rangifer tarandus platyrhynchus]
MRAQAPEPSEERVHLKGCLCGSGGLSTWGSEVDSGVLRRGRRGGGSRIAGLRCTRSRRCCPPARSFPPAPRSAALPPLPRSRGAGSDLWALGHWCRAGGGAQAADPCEAGVRGGCKLLCLPQGQRQGPGRRLPGGRSASPALDREAPGPNTCRTASLQVSEERQVCETWEGEEIGTALVRGRGELQDIRLQRTCPFAVTRMGSRPLDESLRFSTVGPDGGLSRSHSRAGVPLFTTRMSFPSARGERQKKSQDDQLRMPDTEFLVKTAPRKCISGDDRMIVPHPEYQLFLTPCLLSGDETDKLTDDCNRQGLAGHIRSALRWLKKQGPGNQLILPPVDSQGPPTRWHHEKLHIDPQVFCSWKGPPPRLPFERFCRPCPFSCWRCSAHTELLVASYELLKA